MYNNYKEHHSLFNKVLYMSQNVQWTLSKIVLQMYVLFVKVLATVETNFNTYTGCRLKTNNNYYSIHPHSIHYFLAQF